jgi:cell division protease FtsH
LDIHLQGKPHDDSVNLQDLVDVTNGLSCSQIENLVNEGMLNALRDDRVVMTNMDLDTVMNKMLVGWQPNEHQFTNDVIDRIAIHEMGHVVLGLLSKHHSRVSKVIINLSSPQSPGYTIFENNANNIHTREALMEHLMILLGGRISEELIYGVSVTTGAINDFEEALKLAEKMVTKFGFGEKIIYSQQSDKYKQMVDEEVVKLIDDAYRIAGFVIKSSKDYIVDMAEVLKRDKIIRAEQLYADIHTKYKDMLQLF